MTNHFEQKIEVPQDFPESINIFIGKNGGGKSETLNLLAKKYISKGSNVIAVSNCVFDKFTQKGKSFHFIGARYGVKMIDLVFKNLLQKIIDDEDYQKIKIIQQAFEYIGYQPLLGFKVKNSKDLTIQRDFLSQEIRSNKIYSNYDYLYTEDTDIVWFDFKSSEFAFNKKLNINFKVLKKILDCKINIDFFIKKYEEKEIQIQRASSGELHLLINLLFVASMINEKNTVIFIDEPECSLHPKWQEEFIEKIYNFFYKYNPKIFIATHSPTILSFMYVPQKKQFIQDMNFKVYLTENFKTRELLKKDKECSIEAILWSAFGIITPENSFLSREITKIIHNFSDRLIGFSEALEKLDSLKSASFDERQKIAIEESKKLLNLINGED